MEMTRRTLDGLLFPSNHEMLGWADYSTPNAWYGTLMGVVGVEKQVGEAMAVGREAGVAATTSGGLRRRDVQMGSPGSLDMVVRTFQTYWSAQGAEDDGEAVAPFERPRRLQRLPLSLLPHTPHNSSS